MVDSDRMSSLLAIFRDEDAAYAKTLYRKDHTEKEIAKVEYSLLRASVHLCHFLNELMLRDQIVVLDQPANSYISDDDLEGVAQERQERREQFETWMASGKMPVHTPSLAERQTLADCNLGVTVP